MKLLLDQGLPRATAAHLRAAGIAAAHVGELGMASAADEAIIEKARASQSVAVTLDADFHTILARSKATEPSVIRIRLQGIKGREMAELLVRVIAATGAELAAGAVVSVTDKRIRVRLLPIGR